MSGGATHMTPEAQLDEAAPRAIHGAADDDRGGNPQPTLLVRPCRPACEGKRETGLQQCQNNLRQVSLGLEAVREMQKMHTPTRRSRTRFARRRRLSWMLRSCRTLIHGLVQGVDQGAVGQPFERPDGGHRPGNSPLSEGPMPGPGSVRPTRSGSPASAPTLPGSRAGHPRAGSSVRPGDPPGRHGRRGDGVLVVETAARKGSWGARSIRRSARSVRPTGPTLARTGRSAGCTRAGSPPPSPTAPSGSSARPSTRRCSRPSPRWQAGRPCRPGGTVKPSERVECFVYRDTLQVR